MLKILEIKDIEDCQGNIFIKEITLNQNVTKELIEWLGGFGTLQYYANLKNPFYKIKFPEGYLVKGSEGRSVMRVLFADTERSHEHFELFVQIIKHRD